jgi:hypothetical protein
MKEKKFNFVLTNETKLNNQVLDFPPPHPFTLMIGLFRLWSLNVTITLLNQNLNIFLASGCMISRKRHSKQIKASRKVGEGGKHCATKTRDH